MHAVVTPSRALLCWQVSSSVSRTLCVGFRAAGRLSVAGFEHSALVLVLEMSLGCTSQGLPAAFKSSAVSQAPNAVAVSGELGTSASPAIPTFYSLPWVNVHCI